MKKYSFIINNKDFKKLLIDYECKSPKKIIRLLRFTKYIIFISIYYLLYDVLYKIFNTPLNIFISVLGSEIGTVVHSVSAYVFGFGLLFLCDFVFEAISKMFVLKRLKNQSEDSSMIDKDGASDDSKN